MGNEIFLILLLIFILIMVILCISILAKNMKSSIKKNKRILLKIVEIITEQRESLTTELDILAEYQQSIEVYTIAEGLDGFNRANTQDYQNNIRLDILDKIKTLLSQIDERYVKELFGDICFWNIKKSILNKASNQSNKGNIIVVIWKFKHFIDYLKFSFERVSEETNKELKVEMICGMIKYGKYGK